MYNPIIFLNREEVWIQIPNIYDDIKPYYHISNYGRLYSNSSNSFITPQINHSGYLQIGLMCNNGSRIYRKLHRLVMISFLYFHGCNDYQVNHMNGNKLDNNIINLEWSTPKENKLHSIRTGLSTGLRGETNPQSKITEEQVMAIYELLVNDYTDNDIMDIIQCDSIEIIRNIAFGRTWRYLFTEEQLYNMMRTRKGYTISNNEKHAICKYIESNIILYNYNYGKVIAIVKDALMYNSLELSNTNIQIAKRLYYRRDNPEIISLYNY